MRCPGKAACDVEQPGFGLLPGRKDRMAAGIELHQPQEGHVLRFGRADQLSGAFILAVFRQRLAVKTQAVDQLLGMVGHRQGHILMIYKGCLNDQVVVMLGAFEHHRPEGYQNGEKK